MDKLANKDVVLFWLRRHAREVENRAAPPSHETMALNRMSHGDRAAVIARGEKAAEATKVELQSLETAIAFVEEHG